MGFQDISSAEAVTYGLSLAFVVAVGSMLAGSVLRSRARNKAINDALDGNGAWSGDGSGVFVRRGGQIEFIPEDQLKA